MTAHIQIVGWNHRHDLAACLQSCLRQTVRVGVLYVDNASTDGSVDFVRKEFPTVRCLENATNRGYSGGHNDGLRTIPDTDVAIVLNADVVLAPDFVEKGLAPFQDARVGAVAPLLLRGEDPTSPSPSMQGLGSAGQGSGVIDSYGDVLLLSLRAVNQYAGQTLAGLRSNPSALRPPWGFTGAAALLRRAALEDVALKGEIFDEDLFAYREDVDLSWRLRLRGWKIVGAPDVLATHERAVRGGSPKTALVARLSWRNYYLVLVKNASVRTLLGHLPWILLEDAARDLQMISTPALWPALPELFRALPRMLAKRKEAHTRASTAPPH